MHARYFAGLPRALNVLGPALGMKVHCGVAPLEVQLSPAGRDWVLLMTFIERLSLREGVRE